MRSLWGFCGSPANARVVLEDLPEDHGLRDRWADINALIEARREANEEVDRYKAELGFQEE